jgi:hypothetical protein
MNLVSVCSTMANSVHNAVVQEYDVQPNIVWPSLKTAASGSILWRIRSLRVVWEPIDTSMTGSVGILATHVARSWMPSSFHDLKARGGIIKPIRSAGWSSNTMPSDQDWYDVSAPAAKIYTLAIPRPTTDVEIGILTAHMVVQFRGSKE